MGLWFDGFEKCPALVDGDAGDVSVSGPLRREGPRIPDARVRAVGALLLRASKVQRVGFAIAENDFVDHGMRRAEAAVVKGRFLPSHNGMNIVWEEPRTPADQPAENYIEPEEGEVVGVKINLLTGEVSETVFANGGLVPRPLASPGATSPPASSAGG